ncbi:subtilisin family serine protease [Methylobacterium sp. BE186]|uniref:S8 family serine peptidase n=1 Tax=Methylobacterium sp. BE186 TaxID=2817715 RepID=UPI00285556FC|nr:S8 family serine peptidase [Methylobacterium sp. BE186]MDR7035604.1 subtilisin family serine protease [Methylobacterium sp. BE186]
MRQPFDTPSSVAGALRRLAATLLLLTGGLAPAAAQTRPGAVLDRGVPARGGYGGGPMIGLPGLIGIVPRLIPPPREVVEEDEPPPRRRPEATRAPEVERPPRRATQVRAVPEPRHPPRRRQAAPGLEASPKPAPKPPKAAARPPNPPPARPAPGPASSPPPARAALAEPGEVPGEVLFALRPGARPGTLRSLLARERLDLVSSDTFTLVPVTLNRARIRGGRSVDSLVAALARDPAVESAQANHAYALVGAAPAFAGVQYAAGKLRLDEAHRTATGRDVPVAVIDSGVDEAHPALQGAVAERYDALGKAGPPAPHPHGTAIAGLLGARAQLASAAPEARLLAVRAFSGETAAGAQGTTLHVLRGIDWAARAKARVVNMSFAGPRDEALARFLAAGVRAGTVYVAAAGNGGPGAPPLYPAADPSVIAVTATDAEDRLFPAASRGAHVCVAAPGVDVLVAAPSGTYGFSSGTSMAAAQVSGLVALMLQARPALAPGEIRAALVRAARDLGAPGPDPEFGAGFADAEGVLNALIAPAVAAAQSSGGMSATPVPGSGQIPGSDQARP